MTDRQIYKVATGFSASTALDAIASALSAIKHESGLTDARIGDPLFKSPDSLRDYREGHREMGAVTFVRGVAAWGAAFGDPVLSLAGYRLTKISTHQIGDCDAGKVSPLASALSCIAAQTAPESPGGASITNTELLRMAREIEAAGVALDELRCRLAAVRRVQRAGL